MTNVPILPGARNTQLNDTTRMAYIIGPERVERLLEQLVARCSKSYTCLLVRVLVEQNPQGLKKLRDGQSLAGREPMRSNFADQLLQLSELRPEMAMQRGF